MRHEVPDPYDNLRFMGWGYFVVSGLALVSGWLSGDQFFGALLIGVPLMTIGLVMTWKYRCPRGETFWEKIRAWG